MLAGDPPFGSATPRVVLARHMRDRPPPIESVRPSVPPQVAAALNRALEKVPADRFPTATAFADALELPGTPPSTTPVHDHDPVGASRTRRRRWSMAGAATIAAAATGAWLWSLDRMPLDDRRVLVFPLQSASAESDRAGAGWDVAIAISASLEHAEPLRVIDGYSYLDADTRRDMRLLTAAEARRLSRQRGARHFVDGAITRRGDSVEVVLRLHDARGDSVVAQESASGDGSTPAPTLGLRAVARLLPRLLDPSRRIDVTHLAERSQSAVALWIQGEREYRRSQFGTALDLFRRALQEDSALAIAAVRGAQAASWNSRLEEAESLASAAVARRQHLPPRYASFAVGLQHYLRGNADSARVVLEGLLRSDVDDPESAMALAEVHQHLLGGPSAPADSAAERWLHEAIRRDTAFTPPLFHLIPIVLRRGDVNRGEALIATLDARGADPALVAPLRLMAACVRGADADWERTASVDGERVLAAARELVAHLAQPRCAERALAALLRAPGTSPGVRWSALLHLNGFLVAGRRDVELRALLDSTVAAGTSQARSLYILDAVAGADRSLMGPKADESAAFARKAYGESYERASPQTRWVLALWHRLQGDTARLARMSAVSDSVAQAGGRRERLFAQSMRAHLALARGDTAAAIEALQRVTPSARRDSLTYELFEPLAVERSTLARLHYARGSYEAAMREASMLEHPEPAIYLAFLPLSLDIRARAAEKLDRRDLAAQYRARLRAVDALHGQRP